MPKTKHIQLTESISYRFRRTEKKHKHILCILILFSFSYEVPYGLQRNSIVMQCLSVWVMWCIVFAGHGSTKQLHAGCFEHIRPQVSCLHHCTVQHERLIPRKYSSSIWQKHKTQTQAWNGSEVNRWKGFKILIKWIIVLVQCFICFVRFMQIRFRLKALPSFHDAPCPWNATSCMHWMDCCHGIMRRRETSCHEITSEGEQTNKDQQSTRNIM